MAVGTQDETPAYSLELLLEQTAFPINSLSATRLGAARPAWCGVVELRRTQYKPASG